MTSSSSIDTTASCQRCDSPLINVPGTSGCCDDITCPYHDHPQWLGYEYMTEHTTPETEALIAAREGQAAVSAYRARAAEIL